MQANDREQKTVLLGVTGCIAAYKACEILRALQKQGVRVKVVMTKHATQFVGAATFRALTHETVALTLFDAPDAPIHHISLAQEADAFLIAPCTANVAAKIACGIADDILTTTALACKAPLVIAPAMNKNMYEAAATQENLTTLKRRGATIVDAERGYLACGSAGAGRLAQTEHIVAKTLEVLNAGCDNSNEETSCLICDGLEGKNVLVTAGPTQEPIDPVRYLTNRSSGKMGYAIAQCAAACGANVTLVTGPVVALNVPSGVSAVQVQTAEEMFEASQAAFNTADVAIFTAAVADVRPKTPSAVKLKKGSGANLKEIKLVENPDILATLAAKKKAQVVVGFAAETSDVLENAKKKLAVKGADFIVANKVGEGITFGTDSIEAAFVESGGVTKLQAMPKPELAKMILDKVCSLL